MTTYHVKVGAVDFVDRTVKNLKELHEQVREQIEQLHPLNSSEEGREIYRNRFRNQPIFHREKNSKNWFNELGIIVDKEDLIFNID